MGGDARLHAGRGVGYDRRTGDVAPLPLVAFSWEPAPDLLVRGVLPQFFSLRYRVATPVTLGLEAGMDGERYHRARSVASWTRAHFKT